MICVARFRFACMLHQKSRHCPRRLVEFAKQDSGRAKRNSSARKAEKTHLYVKNPVNPCKYAPSKSRPNLRVILSLALALTSFVPQNGQKICCQPLLESQRWMDGLGVRAGQKTSSVYRPASTRAPVRAHLLSLLRCCLLKHPEPELNEWGRQGERTR